MAIVFENEKLELHLEAQSPMIHFQWQQDGATLRASEVKPKLDRFLLRELMRDTNKTVDELKKDNEYKSIFTNPDHDALNYKMQIYCEEKPEKIELDGRKSFSMYYGNSGRKEDEIIGGIVSNPTLVIVCFRSKLKELIIKYVLKFFIVTNFGTMQNKGFGSFLPRECNCANPLSSAQTKRIAQYLMDVTESNTCYGMIFEAVPMQFEQKKNLWNNKFFSQIKLFYGIMKSGYNINDEYDRSYIYQYMHNNPVGNIDNEKAWMKQQRIAPIVSKPGNERKHDRTVDNPKYVRAMLGTGSNIAFGERLDVNNRGNLVLKGRRIINIISNTDLERVSSPIFFKIIKNVVFIVAYDVADEVYNSEFTFKSNTGTGSLSTPSKEEFNVHDFLASYVKHYNGELRKKVDIISNNKRVEILYSKTE